MITSFHKNHYLISIFIRNKRLTVIFLVLLSQFINSCSNKTDEFRDLPGINFGTTSYYDSFLFSDSQNLPLKKKLEANFNNWAISNDAEVEFTLIQEDGDIVGSPGSETKLIVNGQLSPDGKFKLTSKNKTSDTLDIAIHFSPSKKSRDFNGFLQMESGKIERINNIEIDGAEVKLFKWNARQSVLMNPLKKGLIWFAIFLGSLLLIWFLILRNLIYPKMGMGQIIVNSPYFKSIKTKGLREITFSDQAAKQGRINKIFAGKKVVEKNNIWQEELKFTPVNRKQLRLKLPTGYSIDPFTSKIKRGSTYLIKKENLEIKISYL